jgi:DNA polymerase
VAEKDDRFAVVTDESGVSRLTPPPCKLGECNFCGLRANVIVGPVPGRGNTKGVVMVVGQGPTREDDKVSKAFSGETGDELRRWFQALGLDESQVYFTFAAKCFGGEKGPTAREADICRDTWLVREVGLLPNVRVVITLGKVGREALLGRRKEDRVSLLEASRAKVVHPLGRELVVLPLPNPTYYLRSREEKPYFLRVVLPEVKAVLAELGVVRGD